MANTYYSAGIDLNLKDGVTPVLDKIDQRLNNLENSFKSLEDKGTSAGDNTGASLEAMGVKTVAVGVLAEKAFEQVVKGLMQIVDWTAQAVKVGVAHSDAIDKMNIGLAGLITNSQIWTDSQGKSVTGTAAFNSALGVSTEIISQLHEAANKYGLDLDAMGKAFELNTAKMSGAKLQLQDQAKLLIDLSLAGKAAGIDVSNLSQQVMAFLNGAAGQRNKLGAVLGFTPDEIKNAERMGTLLQLVQSKMDSITEAVRLQNETWSGGIQVVKNQFESLLGDSFKPLAEAMGAFTKDLLEFINRPEIKEDFKNLGKGLAESFENARPGLTNLLSLVVLVAEQIATIVKGVLFLASFADANSYDVGVNSLDYKKGEAPAGAPNRRVSTSISWGPLNNKNKPQTDTDAGKEEIRLLQQQNELLAQQDPLLNALLKAQQNYDNASIKTSRDNDANLISAAQGQREYALQTSKLGLEQTAAYRKAAEDKAAIDKAAAEKAVVAQAVIDKLLQNAQTSIQETWDKVNVTMLTGEEAQFAAVDAIIKNQIDNFIKVGNVVDDIEQKWVALSAWAATQKENISAVNAAKLEAIQTNLQDEIAGVTDDSLTKQMASLQKKYDDEVIKINLLKGAHSDAAKYDIELAAQLRDKEIEYAQMAAYGVQTNLKSISDFSKSIWTNMGQAFQTGFYDVLTGKFNDLGNVLKNLWDSILKDFSKMLSDMLKNWIYTLAGMGNAASSGSGSAPSLIGSLLGASGATAYAAQSGGIPGLQGGAQLYGGQQVSGLTNFAGTYGVLAGGAVMAGSAIYNGLQSNSQPYTVAGQQYTGDFGGNSKFGDYIAPALTVFAGAVVAASGGLAAVAAGAALVVPVWGWIAAAAILLVGAILSIINGPKEMKVPLPTSMMGDGTPAGEAMMQVYGHTIGSLMQTNKLGGGSTADFSQYMNANMEGTKSWQPYLHAGSGDDLTKDATNFFTNVLPKINIEQAFGQHWSGQYHSGTDAGYAGISGAPIMDPGSFDENAPIPQMLKKIGLLPAAIHGIAMQIDLKDPATFLTWLNNVVGVVVGFKDVITNLNKSWGDIQNDTQKANWHGGFNPLHDLSQGVSDQALIAQAAVGDDKITQEQTLIKLSNDYYNSAVASLKVLTDMINTVSDQVSGFTNSTNQYYKSSDWLASDRTNRLGITGGIGPGGQYGPELANDNTTASVQKTWDAFMKDANDQLNYLVGILNTLNAALDSLHTLAKGFQSIVDGTYATNWKDISSLTGESGRLGKIDLTTGNGADGKPVTQAFLDNVGLLSSGLGNLLSNLQAFMAAVAAGSKSLATGTGADIWQNNYMLAGNIAGGVGYSGANSQQDMIRSKIQEDMNALGSVTNPDDATAYASEIRGLLHTYEGFFSPGDANYNEAYNWANGVLTQLNTVGQASFTRLKNAGVDIGKGWSSTGGSMLSSEDQLKIAIDATKTSIVNLGLTVDAFGLKVETKLGTWATDITDDMKKAAKALKDAMDNFTLSLGGDPATGGGGTGPGKGPLEPLYALATATTGAVGDENSGLIGFTAAVNAASAALVGVHNG